MVKVDAVLVRYKDGHGQEATRLALVIPGGEVYFLNNNSVDMRPAQTWLREGIKKRIK